MTDRRAGALARDVVRRVGPDHAAVPGSHRLAGSLPLAAAVYPATATPSKQPGRLSKTVYVLAREVMCPVFHDFAPPGEHVASCVGLLGC